MSTIEPGQIYEARYQTGNKIQIIGLAEDGKKYIVEKLTGKQQRSLLTEKQLLGVAWKRLNTADANKA